jgi:hypothetical protein
VYTPEERESLRTALIDAARKDSRISGGAITGSASVGAEDSWSDVDLAFGVRNPSALSAVVEDFSAAMRGRYGALDQLDVPSGAWLYRVFLLPNTLQVDLAFAPASDFGARTPTFRRVFGQSVELPHVPPPDAGALAGWAWLYALHVRSSILRGKPWQAEHMLNGMRDNLLSLACLRHGLPARECRGTDQLPPELLAEFEATLVRSLDRLELARAFGAATDCLIDELFANDERLGERLEPALLQMVEQVNHHTGGSRNEF